ncbi:Ig-like domain-containing protein [Ketobacter sp.]|uniref:Ig-like domain-containing protein n=1 Tax=Ketobacter sp. TaxID=2083498 RepID=UPI0025BD8D33|nr:Ig-like domain-containing protein [Ketobacter sp.]
MSAIRWWLIFGCMLLVAACGGGGGGSGGGSGSDQTQSSGSGNGESGSSGEAGGSGADGASGSDSGGSSAGGSDRAGNSNSGSGGANSRFQAPRVISLWSDGVAFGEGRIIDDTISFSGTAEPNHIIEFWLNGVMNGSTVVDRQGQWSLDYTLISLAPGPYSVDLVSISPSGVRVESAQSFLFRYDPTAPIAPIISAVTGDSYILGDGYTSDGTLVVNGTAEPGITVTLYQDGVAIGSSLVDDAGNWVVDHSATDLPDGSYMLTADGAFLDLQSAISPQFPVTVDRVAPTAPATLQLSDDTGISALDGITSDVDLVLSGTTEPNAQVRVRLGPQLIGNVQADAGGNWTLDYTTSPFSDGNYEFALMATDRAGNQSPWSPAFPLVIDTLVPNPVASIALLPDTGILGDGITSTGAIQLAGTADPGDWVEVFVDGVAAGLAPVDVDGNWLLDLTATPLLNGSYAITTQVVDTAGNRSSLSSALDIVINTILPNVPAITGITSDSGVAGDYITSDTTLLLQGSADIGAVVHVLVDGVEQGTANAGLLGNWSFDLGTLADGLYVVTTFSHNIAGSQSGMSAPRSITVDTLAPALPALSNVADDSNLSDGITNDTTLIFSGNAEPNSTVDMWVDGVARGTVSADGSGAWQFDLSATPFSDGNYTLSWQAADAAGNVSAFSSPYALRVDTAAPAAPLVLGFSDDTGSSGDLITADTTLLISGSAEAGATVEVFVDGISRGTTSADVTGVWSYDLSGSPLADGSYSITAEAVDVAGNRSVTSAAFSLTVDSTAPPAPVVSAISTDTAVQDGVTSDATLVFSGSAEVDAAVTVYLDGSSIGSAVASGGVWSFDYSGTALADGSYSVTATATDVAGNVSAASAAFALVVDTALPAAPFVLAISDDTGTAGDAITADTTLIINGSSEADATVDVYLDAVLIGVTTADAGGNWAFDYSATVLANGTYTATAVATDLAGNVSAISAGFSIEVDAAPPAAPVITGISDDTATAGDGITNDSTLLVYGTAEAGATVTVYQDGVVVGSTAADGSGNWSFDHSATSLAGGSYSFTAVATDAAGNDSVASSAYAVTVDSAQPLAPVIATISNDTGATDGITNDTGLVFSGTGEAGSTLDLMLDGASIANSGVDGSGNWSVDYSVTILSEGSYVLTATQTDTAGNTSPVSTAFPVVIDVSGPQISTLSPADGAVNVGLNDNLVLNFDENVYADSGNLVIHNAGDDSVFETIPLGDARITGAGTATITVDPAGTLFGGSGYYVLIDNGAWRDVATNDFAGVAATSDWNFSTGAITLTGSTPADEDSAVLLNATITLNFSEVVYVNSGNIVIHKTSDGSVWDTIDVTSGQVSGSGSNTIVVTQTDVLEPNTGYYINIDAGALENGNGVGFAGISNNSDLNFTSLNASIPTITNVTSSTADGTYGVGAAINVSVQFSEAVNVTLDTPQLELDMEGVDRRVDLASGSGTATLSFDYSVVLGDGALDLDYTNATALLLNGARIRSVQYANADLTLPDPAAAGSLSFNKDIDIEAQSLDVTSMTSADGFQVQGSVSGEHIGWAVSTVGDINGDGFEDFVTGAPDSSGSSGLAYVVYGQAGATRSNLNSASITNGINGFRIVGIGAVDKMGGAVGGAGDINDDGYDDLYVIAPLDDDYAADGGILYVVYGGASNGDVNVSSFSSAVGFRVTTAEANARIGDSFTDFNGNGQALDAGGDFNGDGIDDLVVGMRYSDEDGADSGKAYVIFGQAGATRADVDLDMINPTGPDGMKIMGAGAGWQLGQAARFVGDYDADGYDDVVVSAIFSDALGSQAGQSFLIFGSPGPVFNAIDVSTLSGGSGFKIQSSVAGGILGHSVAGGDFNGDGISDLVVSSNGKDGSGRSANGVAYVLYGNDSGSYSNIDVDSILSSEGFALFGEADADQMGHSLASAGDFNADGVDDLLLGAYLNASGGASAGAGYMVMGKDGSNRSDVDLAGMTNVDGFKVIGDNTDDRLGQSTGQADVNGDGYTDLIIGAPLGDNASLNAGETVVIWGRDFSQSVQAGLVGDANANNLVGTSGNDTLVSGGGADAISAGAGDDIIQLVDTDFYNIEGGLGSDTIQFTTGLNNLDLTSFGPEVINGIEVIDLGDNGNTLTLSQKSLLALSRESRVLYVKGGSSDAVSSSAGDGWCYTGTRSVSGTTYHVYLDEGAVLYVQTGIDVSAVPSFNNTQQYSFNTTSGGANVSGSVRDFPVLIRISNGIAATLQGSRADLRFTDRDQLSWLPYELEIGPSGQLNAWVLVPQVDGNSNADYIVMHYNDVQNGAVPDRQNPTKVWKDYGAVWHFDEGTSGTAYDSTAYQNNALQTNGNVGDNSDRLIGYGRNFSGNEVLQAPYDLSFNANNRAYTIESWVREPGLFFFGSKARREILSRGTGGSYWNMTSTAVIFSLEYSPRFEIGNGSGSSNVSFDGGGVWFTSEQWVHQVMVVDPSAGVRIYTNGSLQGSTGYRNMENGQAFKMGSSDADFQLDEVRYGRFAADANRIRLSYQNQRSSGHLVSP